MKKVLIAIVIALGFWGLFSFYIIAGAVTSSGDSNMLTDINEARSINHLFPLTENPLLDKSAHNKACDMRDKNYFGHISPTAKTPWEFIKEVGYNYKDAGENIYKGDINMHQAMIEFLASEEHREIIIKPVYTEVGIGVCGKYIVQHFGDK